MGIQDRDWYWEERAKKERAAKKSTLSQRAAHIPVKAENVDPPKLWGADWHWSLQLLVWLCIAVLLLVAVRLLR